MKWGWLLGAVGVAAFLVVRRQKLGRWTFIGGWVVVAVAGLIGAGVIPLPNLEKLLEDAGETLGKWTYLLVGVLAYLETGAFVGFVAPGETAVIVGGLVAGQGQISLFVLIAIVWACAVAGDVTSFFAGPPARARLAAAPRRAAEDHRGAAADGRGVLRAPRRRDDPRRPVHRLRPRRSRRSWPAPRGCRSGASCRTTCSAPARGRRLRDARLRLLAVVRPADAYVSRGLFAFGTVVVLAGGLVWLVQLRRSPERRAQVRAWLEERRDRRGWSRWSGSPAAVARGRPPDRVGDRHDRALRPGPAHAGRAGPRADDAAGAPGGRRLHVPVPRRRRVRRRDAGLDRMAADVADQLETGRWSTSPRWSRTSGRWRWSRRWSRSWSCGRREAPLDRCRDALRRHGPDGRPRARVQGGVRPPAAHRRARPRRTLRLSSGHTAYAVAWVACATVLVRAGTGWAVRFAAVTVACALVVVVGATRVYLGVHHLTDVIGGAALGVAIWALVGAIALVAGYVRQNGRRTG